jgi:KUP system potassium uptake protein
VSVFSPSAHHRPGLRTRRVHTPRWAASRGRLGLLSLGALGVVYGDIGTSPLYAFREAVAAAGGAAAGRAAVLGVLSLAFWALLLVVSFKYLAVVMRADNRGEGGILALTALLLPAATARPGRRWAFVLLGVFGAALLYGDGVITPAISVLAAVEGVQVAAPALAAYVVPIAVAILVALFAVQRFGTGRVGAAFGPVMVVWFAVLGVLGAAALVQAPAVLVALNPLHGLDFLAASPAVGFLVLGSVFLVVTGAEALYADMGHFGRRPIQLGWFAVVLPALVLNYFGQGALLLSDAAAAEQPFFALAPDWAVLPLVALATVATVIASQALISGAFSLTMQAAQLGFLPRVRIDHTSDRQYGQVYVPAVNLALLVGCVAVVIGFGSSANLAGAYGIAVSSTMIITTVLLASVAQQRWGWPPALVALLTGVFLVVDLAFFAANLAKVARGGWFPLAVGLALFVVMTTWFRGRRAVAEQRRLGSGALTDFVAEVARTGAPRVPGVAVYLGADLGRTPSALEANLATHHVLHERVYVATVVLATHAHVAASRQVTVHDLGHGISQLVLTFGYLDEPDVPATLQRALPEADAAALAEAVYFVGLETIAASQVAGMALWRERLFALMHRNAASVVRYFRLPRNRIVEVGAVVEI